MKLPDPGSLHSRRDLQRTFAFPDSCHVGEVSMPDLRLQRRSDPVLALQKKGRVRFAPETVRCVIKLQSQVHHTSLQLRRHFLFTERGEFSAFRFNQRRRSGEQHQSAGARRHRWAPVRLTARQATKSDSSRVKCPRVSKVKRAIRLYESPRRIDGPGQLSLL